jgi:hypothetical protein
LDEILRAVSGSLGGCHCSEEAGGDGSGVSLRLARLCVLVSKPSTRALRCAAVEQLKKLGV